MDNLALLMVSGVLLYIFPPGISEIGVQGGPTWPEDNYRDHPVTLMTVGATAYAPVSERFGFRFGAAYKQGSYWLWRENYDCPGPCGDRFRDQIDHIDFSVIAEASVARQDGLDLRLMFGPTWGIPVRCRAKNLTRGTEGECHRTKEDARLVAGAGLAIQATERVSVTMELRYGINLREWDLFRSEHDGIGIARTFVAGVNYRLNR